VFCGPALQRLREAPFKEVIVTDTIPLKGCDGIPVNVLTVSELIGEAIVRTHEHRSVSSLFD
jgi:ribose-phosphate pyrophosphokinase